MRWALVTVAAASALVLGADAPAATARERLPAPTPAMAAMLEAERTYQTGDLLIAQVEFERVLGLDASIPAAWFRLGLIHQRLGDAPRALAAYQRVLELAGERPAAEIGELAAKSRYNRALLQIALAEVDLRGLDLRALQPEQRESAREVATEVRAILSRMGRAPEVGRESAEPVAARGAVVAPRETAPATAVGTVYRTTPTPGVQVIQGGMSGGREQ